VQESLALILLSLYTHLRLNILDSYKLLYKVFFGVFFWTKLNPPVSRYAKWTPIRTIVLDAGELAVK